MTTADVLVVGAGPGGIAAATAAAERGLHVVVLDDNPLPGGQIWRGGVPSPKHNETNSAKDRAMQRFSRSSATLLTNHRVFDADAAASTLQVLCEHRPDPEVMTVHYKHLIIATGARERFIPFPGWTSPGVFGAGGLQALVKGGFNVNGKRVVVAGTGPLLLAVAAHLKEFGANIVCITEQATKAQLAPFAISLWRQPGKLLQGAGYQATLLGSPYRTGCWPVEAIADTATNQLRAVRLTNGKRTWEERCDLLACGFHLVPNTELASLLGCAMNDAYVKVDAQQRTSVQNVFCVGEPTGIAGLDAALVQGEIAGLTCANASTQHLQSRSTTEKNFGVRLNNAFALRAELRSLAKPDTLVCRCEDVTFERVRPYTGWTDAKLQTRCGMGPCQGRICGPAVETLLGWKPSSVRPPLFPVPLAKLCPTQKSELILETRKENT